MDKAIKMVAFFAHVSFVEEPISFHLISRAICKRIYQAIDDGIYLWSPSFFFSFVHLQRTRTNFALFDQNSLSYISINYYTFI